MMQSCFHRFLETPRIEEWPEETWGQMGHCSPSTETPTGPVLSRRKVLERVSLSLITNCLAGGPEVPESGRSQLGPRGAGTTLGVQKDRPPSWRAELGPYGRCAKASPSSGKDGEGRESCGPGMAGMEVRKG